MKFSDLLKEPLPSKIFTESSYHGYKEIRDMEKVLLKLKDSDFKDFDYPKNIYYIKIKYENNIPIGFVLMEHHNEKGNKVVYLSVAVIPKYRKSGIAFNMCKNAINYTKRDSNISKIYWGAERYNQASINLAKKLGFSHDYDTDKYTVFSIK